MVDVYLCNVPQNYPMDYDIAKKTNHWGVKSGQSYKNRWDSVRENGIIIIEHMNKGFLIGIITKKLIDYTPIWPIREDYEVYPYRVQFKTLFEFNFPSQYGRSEVNDILIKCLIGQNGIHYRSPQELGGGLQAVNGQYRRLNRDEYCCIFKEIKSRKNIDIIAGLRSQGILYNECGNEEYAQPPISDRDDTAKSEYKENTLTDIPKNIILHGPVGSGKTYTAGRLAKLISCNICNDEELDFNKIINIIKGNNLEEAEESAKPNIWLQKFRRKEHIHEDIKDKNTEYNNCLVSASRSADGRNVYENLKMVKKGDIVFHLDLDSENNEIVGISSVAGEAETINAFSDSSKEYYYVPLENYKDLKTHISFVDLRNKYRETLIKLQRKEDVFYDKNLNLKQGNYLSPLSMSILELFENYLEDTNGVSLINYLRDMNKEVCKDLCYRKSIKYVTFHKSYSYEDFIVGIKAKTKNGQLEYRVEDGVFKKFCEKAEKDPSNNYVMVIDEINRGDISRIFGELITLVEEDKRGIVINLPYTDDEGNLISFSVPSNLYIIGTMNDSDRSVALIDVALRRRFKFFRVGFNKDILLKWLSIIGDDKETILKFIEYINRNIVFTKGMDYEIGHAFFQKLKNIKDVNKAREELTYIFSYSIMPLLEEYFHSDMTELQEFLDEFYEKEERDDDYTNSIPYVHRKEIQDYNDLINKINNVLNKYHNESV